MSNDTSGLFQPFVEQVRARTDLVELLRSDGIKLERTGSDWKCCSPFRADKTPSFWVYENGGWHDFGTSESGGCFDYVMRRDVVDFKTAVAVCAKFAGITPYWEEKKLGGGGGPLTPEAIADAEIQIEKEAIFDRLTESAVHFHEKMPTKIRDIYKSNYGFTDATIDKYKLGYDGGTLVDFLKEEKGYSTEAIARTGIFLKAGQEQLIPMFEGRLTMPYWHNGKVVYFIARKTIHTADNEHEKAKYKKLITHSSKHPGVSKHIKNDWIFNEEICKRHLDYILVTEGVTDCLAAIQANLHAISPITTSFKASAMEHVKDLFSKTETIYVCNDNDVLADGSKPGERGALKTAEFCFGIGKEVRIVVLPLPEGQTKVDLCDYLRTHGETEFRRLMAESKDYIEFLIDKALSKKLEPAEIEENLKSIFKRLAQCKSDVLREAYTNLVAKRFEIDKKTIKAGVQTELDELESTRKAAEKQEKKEAKSEERAQTKAETPKSSAAPASNGAARPPSGPTMTGPPGGSSPPGSRNNRIRGEVFEDLFSYYVKNVGGNEEIVSSFVLRPKARIKTEDGFELFQVDFETENGQVIRNFVIPKRAWRSTRDFKDCLPSPSMQWTGTDDQVQGVMRLLSVADVPTKTMTKNIGLHIDSDGNASWVWPGHMMTSEGIVEHPTVVCLPQSAGDFASRVHYTIPSKDEAKAIASEVYPNLMRINEPRIMLPMIGWFFSTPFKPYIMDRMGHFPILMVWGTPGSGKTSLLTQIFWPMFGMRTTDGFSADETRLPIVMKLSATNSIPIFFDEIKRKEMHYKYGSFMKLVREVYSGQTEERGKQDMGTIRFKLSAPISFAGESMPDDDLAVMERLICIAPNKHYLNFDEPVEIYKKVRALPLHKLGGPYIQWTLSIAKDIPRLLDEAIASSEIMLARSGRKVSSRRMIDNISVVTFGIQMFDLYCAHLGISLPAVDPTLAYQEMTGHILQGETSHAKDAFDNFLEQLSVYHHKGLLREGVEYVVFGDKVRLHLPSCYDTYLKERRSIGRDDDTNGLRALQRLAGEKVERGGYVTHNNKVTDMKPLVAGGRNQMRCVEIDQTKVPSSLDFKWFGWKGPEKSNSNENN